MVVDDPEIGPKGANLQPAQAVLVHELAAQVADGDGFPATRLPVISPDELNDLFMDFEASLTSGKTAEGSD